MPDNVDKLYDALNKDGLKMGRDQFRKTMEDPNHRKGLYDAMRKDGYKGDFNSFERSLGYGNEAPTQRPAPEQGSRSSSSPKGSSAPSTPGAPSAPAAAGGNASGGAVGDVPVTNAPGTPQAPAGGASAPAVTPSQNSGRTEVQDVAGMAQQSERRRLSTSMLMGDYNPASMTGALAVGQMGGVMPPQTAWAGVPASGSNRGNSSNRGSSSNGSNRSNGGNGSGNATTQWGGDYDAATGLTGASGGGAFGALDNIGSSGDEEDEAIQEQMMTNKGRYYSGGEHGLVPSLIDPKIFNVRYSGANSRKYYKGWQFGDAYIPAVRAGYGPSRNYSGMDMAQLADAYNEAVNTYTNSARSQEDKYQCAADTGTIIKEMACREAGFKNLADANNNPGHRDYALLKGGVDANQLSRYESMGSGACTFKANPIYAQGTWNALMDRVAADVEAGQTRNVDAYIYDALVSQWDAYEAYILNWANKSNRSAMNVAAEVIDDMRDAVYRGDRKWHPVDDKQQMADFVNSEYNRMSADVDDMMKARREELYKEWNNLSPRQRSMLRETFTDYCNADPLYANMFTARRILRDTNNTVNAAMNQNGFLVDSWRGFKNTITDERTWTAGLIDLRDQGNMLTVVQKFKNGTPLNQSEQSILDAVALKTATEAFFAEYVPSGYKAGATTAQALEFIAEMMVGSGFASKVSSEGGKLLLKGMQKMGKTKVAQWLERIGVGKVIRRFLAQVEKSVGRGTLRSVGRGVRGAASAAVEGVVLANTVGVGHTLNEAQQRMTPEVSVGRDNQGHIAATGIEREGKSFWRALGEAEVATGLEFGTEMLGDYVLEPFLKVVNRSLRSLGAKGMDKLGLKNVREAFSGYKGGDMYRAVQDFRKQVHYNGSLGEYLEEVSNNVLNALTVGDMNFNNPDDPNSVFNLKTNWETYVSCQYMSAMFGLANVASYRSPKTRAGEDVANASMIAEAAFGVDEWSNLEDMIRNGDDAKVEELMVNLCQSDKYTPEQRRAAINYAGAVARRAAIEDGEDQGDKITEEDATLRELFGRGYDLRNIEAISEAKAQYDNSRAAVAELVDDDAMREIDNDPAKVLSWLLHNTQLSEEDRNTVLAYINAKMTYEGAKQRLDDDLEAEVAQSNALIDRRVYASERGGDGKIHPITMLATGKTAYVVGGNVSVRADGSIDEESSDNMIIIVNENGDLDTTPPSLIGSVGELQDPDAEKQTAETQIRSKAAAVLQQPMEQASVGGGEAAAQGAPAAPEAAAAEVASSAPEASLAPAPTPETIPASGTAPEAPAASPTSPASSPAPETNPEAAAEAGGGESQAGMDVAPEDFKKDDEITVKSGDRVIRGQISRELDANGKIEIFLEEPLNGQAKVIEVTPEELNNMLVSHTSRDAVAQQGQQPQVLASEPQAQQQAQQQSLPQPQQQAQQVQEESQPQPQPQQQAQEISQPEQPQVEPQPQSQQQQVEPQQAQAPQGQQQQEPSQQEQQSQQEASGVSQQEPQQGELSMEQKAEIFVDSYYPGISEEERSARIATAVANGDFENTVAYDKQDGRNPEKVAAYEQGLAAARAENEVALATPQTGQLGNSGEVGGESGESGQPQQAPSQPSLPVGKDGNADFSNATPQEAHDYIYNDPELDEEEASQAVQNHAQIANDQLAQAQTALEQAKAVPAPIMKDYGTDVAGYKRAKKQRNDAVEQAQAAVDAAQRDVDLWNGVQAHHRISRARDAAARAAGGVEGAAPNGVPGSTGADGGGVAFSTRRGRNGREGGRTIRGRELRDTLSGGRAPVSRRGERVAEGAAAPAPTSSYSATAGAPAPVANGSNGNITNGGMTPDERIEEMLRERRLLRAKEIAAACGIPSHVIESIDDPSLPESYRRKIKELAAKGEMVEGWYDTNTGHMYFYMPGIRTMNRLDEVFAHETVAHGGLRLLLRGKDGSNEDFEKLCDNVWNKMSVLMRARFMNYVVSKHASTEDWKDPQKRDKLIKDGLQNKQYQREAADEYMAKLSELYERQKRHKGERGRIMRVVDAIRDAIRRHFRKSGVTLDININSAKDIMNLLDESKRNLTEMDAVTVSTQIDNAISNGEQTEADAANGMFSTTSIFEGAGFEVQQIDENGNSVPMVDSKGNMIVKLGGKEFSAEHPVTVKDLKPKMVGHEALEVSVLQMLVEDAKEVNGLSAKKADKIYQNYADILNMYLYMGSAEMGGPEAVERNWEWLGDTVFRTIAANGDAQYSYSMDIIRVCKKNEAVIKAMSAHQLLSGRGATPSEIVDIYRKTYVEGYQVPCPVCYVFTRYIRNGKYASAAIRGMETYGEHLPGGSDVWTAKQWADELDRLNRLTNPDYKPDGKNKLEGEEAEEAKRFKKALDNANEITVKYEKRLNALSFELTSPGLTAEREQEILAKIKTMDAQYQSAIDVISFQALTNWIKTHAIEEKKGSGWKLRDDAQKPADINDYKANALDLRKTANTIVNYPAIQRLRKSGGSAGGKEISFASNNELGEVVSGLGISSNKLGSYANPYQQALLPDLTKKQRKDFRKKARERFKDASTYAAMQTLRGGQRMWSWSDNIERLSPDVAINLIQLELLNGAMQTYSKQLEGVKLAAQMGAYVNGSLMAKDNGWLEVSAKDVNEVNGEMWLNHDITDVVDEPQVGGGTVKRERVIAGAGSHVYQTDDGRLVVLQFDDIVGIDPYGNREITGKDGKKKKAKGLFELNEELDKAGNILVGMNDLHIRVALADPRVFFVIPWHSSGANNHILSQMFNILEQRIDNSVDYTDMQEEKNMGERNKDTKALPEVTQKLRDLWEEGRQWGEENGWKSGMEIDSNGDVMTESQYMYRQLRSLIFSGEIFENMPSEEMYRQAVADANAYNARLTEIQQELDRGGLTAEQKKALEKERDKIRPKFKEVQHTADLHDGMIDWRDSAVHKNDAAWNAAHPKRISIAEARKMILADEFLKQVYNRVKPIGKMTSKDNTFIYPYEYWDESSTYDNADINGKRYVEYCRRMGYKPKFAGNWKTKDVSKQSDGDFVHDPGYWKLLIDRRMYDREGNYQWLDPVTSEDFNTDLINPMETQHEFHVTTVADDAAADAIASKVFEEESKTPGGFAHANYDKPLDEVVDDFEKAMEPGVMFSSTLVDENSEEEIEAMHGRIDEWMAQDNLDKAIQSMEGIDIEDKGQRRSAVFNTFAPIDNAVYPINYVPKEFLKYIWAEATDNNAYATMAYFIEHAVNHHPNIPAEKYHLIMDVISHPESIKETIIERNGMDVRSVIFIKKNEGRYNAVVVSLEKSRDGGIAIMYKSLFDQSKKVYKKSPDLWNAVDGENKNALEVTINTPDGPITFKTFEKEKSLRSGGTLISQSANADPISNRLSDFNDLSGGKGTTNSETTKENSEKNAENAEKSSETTDNGGGMMLSASPIFYSNAERAVEGVKQNKATAEQWKAMLTKVGGIKVGEDKWMGLSTWLDENKGKSLTKDEVLQFVRDNSIQMKEVEYVEANTPEEELRREVLGDIYEYGRTVESTLEYYKEKEKDEATFIARLEKEGRTGLAESTKESLEKLREKIRILESADPNDPESIRPPYEANGTRLEYTTDGLRKYREIAFVVPDVESYQENDEVHFGPENEGKAVMWVRFGETTDADGNRVLVIDEIQSNRHQDAREKGYKNPDMQKDFETYRQQLEDKYFEGRRPVNFFNLLKRVATPEEVERYKELSNGNNRSGVPNAPFEKNWHEVAMKRMLRLAAEEGFDKVAWTTGEQQAVRYALGGKVDTVGSTKWDNNGRKGIYVIFVGDDDSSNIVIDRDGNIITGTNELEQFEGGKISDVLGKELSMQLMKEEAVELKGTDISIGGSGMKGFYDQMLPRFMDKYGKRWGVKTGEVELNTPGKEVMHSVDVTPEMKESVMEGQPLFSTRSLGAPYQGTKGRIASQIVDDLPSGDRFVDLFAGGGAVTHAAILSGKYGSYHMNDINPVGQELFLQGVRGEWEDYDRTNMTPEEFNEIKGTPESLPWSYNGLGHNLVKGGRPDYINRMKRLGQLKPYADDITSTNEDYRDVEIRPGDVVYADIPYENTDTRGYGKGRRFDKKAFCDWAQAQDFPIFVSEYTMPKGWVEIDAIEVGAMRRNNKRTEKLWVQEKFADQYRVDNAIDGTEAEVDGVPAYEANNLMFSVLDPERDAELIAELDGQEYVTVYRTMAKVNGEYYPPMDSRDHDNPEKLRNPENLGQYTQSEERPDLAFPEEYTDKKTGEKKTRWKFNLRKSNGKSVNGVAYNPYMHTSDSALNDQFSEAQDRDDLVVVECRVPVSELDPNSYHAEKALDPVGWKPWKAGPIVSKMTGKRNLLLSRWVKPVKELSWSEVADMVSKQLGDQFDVLPSNTFSKGLRAELEKRGYQFIETDNKGIIKEGLYKGVTWSDRYYDIHPEKDNRSNKKQKRAKVAEVKARNAEDVRFSTTAAVDALKDDERVYNALLGKVFSGVSNETRRGIVEDAMRNRDNDFGAATEAWLGSLANDADFAQVPRQDWGKVKLLLHQTLMDNDVDVSTPMSDNEARYVLWKAGQIEDGVFSLAQDIVMQDRLLGRVDNATDGTSVMFSTTSMEEESGESGEDDIRFSMSPRDRSIARDQYERWMGSSKMQWSEAMQDSMLGLKKLMQAVVGKRYKYIEDIPMNENAYVAENLMSSVTAAEQAAFYTSYISPMLKAINKLCKGRKYEQKRQELTDYLMAKHGLERNVVFADRDAQETAAAGGNYQDAFAENRERDYSGLTALTGESDVHAAEAKAQQMVDAYESSHDVTDLWDKINAATGATLKKQYDSGILSYDQYRKLSNMFEYYVPLRGWDETTSDEVYGYLTSNVGPFLGGSIVKHAGGRTSKADDPTSTISMLGDDSIRTGNRNLMKQRFLNFVMNNPSDVVSVSDLWLKWDDVKQEWVPEFADIPSDAPADVVNQIVEQFEADMSQLAQADPSKYKHGREAANIPYRVIPGMEKEHQVLVKRSGRTWVLTINGNPRAAQALNGLTNPDTPMKGHWAAAINGAEKVNRVLSTLYTTLSPAFIVSNFLRDSIYSNNMVWVKESPNYALKFNLNYYKTNPAMLRRLLGKWEKGTLDESKPMEKMFKLFMLNGGETGFAMAQDIDDYKKKIKKELKRMDGRHFHRVVGHFVAEQYDLLGRSIENCARFAAFMTSVQMGRTVERAAYDAKEISVNFNKKGAGGKTFDLTGQTKIGKWAAFVSGMAKSLYTFWNAGVQGTTNIGRAAKRHLTKAQLLFTKWMALGYFAPMIAAAMGAGDGDDEDKNAYYNLPEYIRRSNLCIYLGGAEKWVKGTWLEKFVHGTYLTIPLPIEFRALYGLGELTYGLASGNERYSTWDLVMQYAGQFSQVLPLDMLEGGGGWHAFTPTLAKPLVEAYMLNESWSGLPVYKGDKYDDDARKPSFTKAFSNTSEWLVDLAEWSNRITGGTESTKGWWDWNPGKIEYLLKGYMGGLYSFPTNLLKAGETLAGTRDFEWRNVPFANRVLSQADERQEAKKLRSDYYRYKEEYEDTKYKLKALEAGGNNDLYNYAEKLDMLHHSKAYGHYQIFEDIDAAMAPFRDARKKTTDEDIIQQYEDMEVKLMREMVDMINAYDAGRPVDSEGALRRVLMYTLDNTADETLRDLASKELYKTHGAVDRRSTSKAAYNQRYDALCTAQDRDEDATLQKLKSNAHDLGDEDLYKAYGAADRELTALRKGVHTKKKNINGLGEGDAENDRRIMERYRTRRREILNMSPEQLKKEFAPKRKRK